ncbi:DUF1826 domain-containing protein [Sphingomonas sp. CFBP8993]|uniref:DUF1826 domain-containing protein n=1 Tax=Sphingomonas sp. CFBP8993 TaxID=3096526 RepID=UPI002A6A29FB|nr:DUF1826 domain-containing protein [Sphingomonas sp. CFBP8993]MDY0959482.1 DUF1826 domain-containing protein [Sphingomonas sp. CFBP8993]
MTAIGMERRIAMGCDSALLDHIARPDAALAIWWRRMPEPFRTALARLDLRGLDDLSVEVDLHGSLKAPLRAAGYRGAAHALLCADMDRLVRRHAAVTGEDRLRVRLTVVEGDVPGVFQAERTTFGLTCTYVGPGIQWCCVDGPDAICEVPTGAVGVFKGRALLDPPVILHRSPAIGDPRLVLAIEPARRDDADRSKHALPKADHW